MKKLVREDINFEREQDPKEAMGLGIRLYGVFEVDYDETHLYFFIKEGDARSKFEEINSGALFRAAGDGRFWSGAEFGASGGVEIIDEKLGDWD